MALPAGLFYSSNQGTASTIDCVIPATAAAGDMAILTITGSGIQPHYRQAIVGWTYHGRSLSGTDSSNVVMAQWMKVLATGEPGMTLQVPANLYGHPWVVQIITVRSLHSIHPVTKFRLHGQPKPPSQLSRIIVGAAGTVNNTYKVATVTDGGEILPVSLAVVDCPNTLTVSNYVELRWVPSTSARSYRVYRNDALIGVADRSNITGTESNYWHGFRDTGQAGDVAQAPRTAASNTFFIDPYGPLDPDNKPAIADEAIVNPFASAHVIGLCSWRATTADAALSLTGPTGWDGIGQQRHANNMMIAGAWYSPVITSGPVASAVVSSTQQMENSAGGSVLVRLSTQNAVPVAVVSPYRTAHTKRRVFLSGDMSYDPDNDALTPSWTQTLGDPAPLTSPGTWYPSFIAVTAGARTFRLTVSDPSGAISTNDININVLDVAAFRPRVIVRKNGAWTGSTLKRKVSGVWQR